MRVGCLSYLLPGESTEDRFTNAAKIGVDALEFLVFPDTDLKAWLTEVKGAATASGLGVSALICCQTLLDEAHLPWFEGVLGVAAELDAVVVLTPEYAGRNPPAGMPPLPPPPADELETVKEMLKLLASYAQQNGARIAVEAINRYETRFARSLSEALVLANEAGPNVGVLADFFHLNIEEEDIPTSIRHAGARLMHVHLADSNRFPPGYGHLDFASGFRALAETGYDRTLSLECGLPADKPGALAETVRWIREMWQEIG